MLFRSICFVVSHGHITASAESVVQDWLDREKASWTFNEVRDMLGDLWNGEQSTKDSLMRYAQKVKYQKS